MTVFSTIENLTKLIFSNLYNTENKMIKKQIHQK